MYTFGQLCVGDLFNTKAARWGKISSSEAIVVISGCYPIGKIVPMTDSQEVVLLWSSLLSDDPACCERKSEQPSLSESEKEDRFYRKIEAEIDAENRAQQAAEFKRSLIDELAHLIARSVCLQDYRESGKPGDPESYWLSEQYQAMSQYIVALNSRIDLLE